MKRRRERPLDLAEIVDLELRLASDRELDRRTLRERDEAIGRRLADDDANAAGLDRHALFRRWLAELRDGAGGAPSAGVRVAAAHRLAGMVLGAGALLAGVTTARGVLAYDGTHPVNVIHFLAVFVGLQLVLVALALASALGGGWRGAMPEYGPVHEMLRHLILRRSVSGAVGRRLGDAAAVAGRVGALGAVYGTVERWLLLALTQRTAFFFNLGALLACVYLVTFTDLAFAWSTTLELEADTMTRILRTLSLPWLWLPAAVPDADLVATSRYFRKANIYDPTALKDWWAFLLAALVTYGLLPRLLVWRVAAWRARAARAALPLDHGDAQVAYERFTRGLHGWSAPEAHEHDAEVRARPSRGETPAGRRSGVSGSSRASGSPPPALTRDARPCTVVRWGDVPLSEEEAARLVGERFGWRTQAVLACGGRESTAGRDELLRELAREPDERPLVVLAEAWEAPSRAITGFLADARRSAGARRPLVVALLGARNGAWVAPDPADLDVWERTTAALGDPYVRVEAVVGE